MHINNLGMSLMHRFEQFGEVKDIDEAIKQQHEAIQLTPVDNPSVSVYLNNLGLSLSNRSAQFVKVKDTDEAIKQRCEQDIEQAIFYFNLAYQSQNGYPHVRFRASQSMATLARTSNNLETALKAYTQAINLLPLVAWIGLRSDAQLKTLTSYSTSFVCDAAACAIQLACSHPNSKQQYLQHALELLDHG
jgi:tetratricopeptide (TPR) repeat protein